MAMKKFNFIKKYLIPAVSKIDWANVSAATYVRWILAIIACLNSFLNMIGYNPLNVNESQLYDVVSNVMTIVIMVVNTYKNNSTSTIAIKHDIQMRQEKLDEKLSQQ